ncbi:MAG: penicillin-binding protein 2, partial [Sphingopyxis sp.]|nr:penicillin-binding protein 2 [Sphingopyxis sp.]
MARRKRPPITEAWRGLTFTRRALVVGGAQAAVGIALAARMAYISIVDNDRYILESESNRVNLTLIPPRRGWIVDRNGKALANNRVSLRIDIIPDRLQKRDFVLGQLRTLLRLDGDTMERIDRDLKAASGFQPVAIKEDMTEAEY